MYKVVVQKEVFLYALSLLQKALFPVLNGRSCDGFKRGLFWIEIRCYCFWYRS